AHHGGRSEIQRLTEDSGRTVSPLCRPDRAAGNFRRPRGRGGPGLGRGAGLGPPGGARCQDRSRGAAPATTYHLQAGPQFRPFHVPGSARAQRPQGHRPPTAEQASARPAQAWRRMMSVSTLLIILLVIVLLGACQHGPTAPVGVITPAEAWA